MSPHYSSMATWFCVVTLVACAGCDHPSVDDVNASSGRAAKEWMRSLPTDVDWGAWDRKLEHTQWEFVPESEEPSAESLLRTTSCVRLSDDQLAKLEPARRATGTPYLVRAVSATWRTTTGGTEIQISKDGDLWVRGGVLSHRAVPIERRGIVVWLEQPPREVYVTFGVAE